VCYFSSISVGFKIIEDRFGVRFVQSESFRPVYSASAFDFPSLPVISSEDSDHIISMQWGLIPFWVKDRESAVKMRQLTPNARAETLFEKPAFRSSIQAKRCLILVDGFFEWRHIDNRTYPYYIRLKSRAPFALAGIWDSWTDPETQATLKTFSIITVKANSLLEKVHNTKKRMPAILPPEKERGWIKGIVDRDSIQSWLAPYQADEMEAYPVSRLVNKLGFNTEHPDVLRRLDYPDLPDLGSELLPGFLGGSDWHAYGLPPGGSPKKAPKNRR
jgi:putative SOS response-associated peptidase YedK